jgi:hypothetical protein
LIKKDIIANEVAVVVTKSGMATENPKSAGAPKSTPDYIFNTEHNFAWALYQALNHLEPTACVEAPQEGARSVIDGGFYFFAVARELQRHGVMITAAKEL